MRSKRFRAVSEQETTIESQRQSQSSRSRSILRAVKTENPVPRSFFATKLNGKRLLRRLTIANQIGGFFLFVMVMI